MNRKIYFLILFGIILLALVLRLYKLEDVPPGLNRDEAAIGYTAYSLLKTGRDEHGEFLPLSLKSFGDWKLPLYAYSTVPFIAVFGLTEAATHMPSVVFGIATIFLTYLLVRELMRDELLALLACGMVAIAPWHIFFSRVASEANLAVFLILLGVYLIAKANNSLILMLSGALSFGLTLLAYHGNHLFTPLLFLLVIIIFKDKFFTRSGLFAVVLFVTISGIVYSHTLNSADKTKFSGLMVLNDVSQVHEFINLNRIIYTDPLVARIFHNKLLFLYERITQSYIKAFSPEFLFISGGANLQHNIPDFGNLYLLDAPFILLGLYFLFSRRQKYRWLIFGWILIAPIGASLTKDAPHSARTFAIFPAISIITAYGIYSLFCFIKNNSIKRVCGGLLAGLYFVSLLMFISRYFVLFPYKRYSAWGAPYKEMVYKLNTIKDRYSEVVISKPEYSPYIYYLFYQKSDPKKVQQELEYYPPTQEGFEHAHAFDGIIYKKIDWADELLLPNRLYIDWVESVPEGATQSAILITKTELLSLEKKQTLPKGLKKGDVVVSKIIDQVNLPDGQPFIYFIETKMGSASAQQLKQIQND